MMASQRLTFARDILNPYCCWITNFDYAESAISSVASPSKLFTLPDLHRQVSPLNPACFKLQIQISRPSNTPATEATAVDPSTNLKAYPLKNVNLALHGVSQSGNFIEIMLVAPKPRPTANLAAR
jgi:hypothetical protein